MPRLLTPALFIFFFNRAAFFSYSYSPFFAARRCRNALCAWHASLQHRAYAVSAPPRGSAASRNMAYLYR